MARRCLVIAAMALSSLALGDYAWSQENAGEPAMERPPMDFTTAPDPDDPLGKQVFDAKCRACHGTGHTFAGTVALAAKYQGRLPGELEERTDLTPALVTYFVRNGVSIMPFFRKTDISDAELGALGEYLSGSD